MCVVSIIWLAGLKEIFPTTTVMGLYIIFLLIVLISAYAVVIYKKGFIWTFKIHMENLKVLMIFKKILYSEKAFDRYPGAVAISIGTYLYAILLLVR
ncbi:hypothetical protein [Cytobacillus sp. IB215665]|uniref:hypothetical protein n=1 Tax=Cytobacillus sp. IB215665 TaxID=3097357 RepID=UPI002A100823|nr:hypothetical protein [Cytobacillus sp. IB215665]MDX8367189.1 hypothetical protein [Cytobacillus sp. IB215665]